MAERQIDKQGGETDEDTKQQQESTVRLDAPLRQLMMNGRPSVADPSPGR